MLAINSTAHTSMSRCMQMHAVRVFCPLNRILCHNMNYDGFIDFEMQFVQGWGRTYTAKTSLCNRKEQAAVAARAAQGAEQAVREQRDGRASSSFSTSSLSTSSFSASSFSTSSFSTSSFSLLGWTSTRTRPSQVWAPSRATSPSTRSGTPYL